MLELNSQHFFSRDVPCAMSRSEIEWLFRMEDISKHAIQKISVLEVSARSGQGLDQVAKWIYDNNKEVSAVQSNS
jgi:hypothetical protein